MLVIVVLLLRQFVLFAELLYAIQNLLADYLLLFIR